MLKVLGVGLPRTGTKSLCVALEILGYRSLHHPADRLPLFPPTGFDWRQFDDVDAVCDAPACMYWRELLAAYPEAKAVLTVRDEEDWWRSMRRHVEVIRAQGGPEHVAYSDTLHGLLFGTAEPSEYWWRRRYEEHNSLPLRPVDRLVLRFDVRDGWGPLCRFLDRPVPPESFPWKHRGDNAD